MFLIQYNFTVVFMSLKDIELYSSVQEKKYDDVVLCYWKNLKLFNVLSKALP